MAIAAAAAASTNQTSNHASSAGSSPQDKQSAVVSSLLFSPPRSKGTTSESSSDVLRKRPISRDSSSRSSLLLDEAQAQRGGLAAVTVSSFSSAAATTDASPTKKRESFALSFLKHMVPGLTRRSISNKTLTERTPLLLPTTTGADGSNETPMPGGISFDPLGSSAAAAYASDPLLQETPIPPTKSNSRWKNLKKQVQGGELLLQSVPDHDTNTSHHSKEHQRLQVQAEIRSVAEFTLQQCVAAILAYVLIAVIAFSVVFDHWSVIDSAYFAVVTFTTIGYGDVVPDTYPGRIFTCFFALSGVAFLGIALGIMGNKIIEAEHKAMEQAGEISKYRVVTLFSSSSVGGGGESSSTVGTAGDTSQEGPSSCEVAAAAAPQPSRPIAEAREVQRNPVAHILREFVLLFLILLVFAAVIANDPGVNVGWDLGSGLYYAIITATTIGYGDFAPETQKERLIAIFFIPLAVGAMGHWLSIVASSIIDSRQSNFHRRLQMQELSQHDLDMMDDDGDGNVSRAEFLEFMLVAMNKVDKDFIEEMRRHFSRLDTDNTGTLSKNDLIAAAKRKLKNPLHKLQLANYKQQLLQQAADSRVRHRRGAGFWGSGDVEFSLPTMFRNSEREDDNVV